MNKYKPFFWLHIKKCGGESFRKTFTPPYVQTERVLNPKPFIAIPKREWNDLLNTFKVPLGEYDYKRTLFAKTFLYSKKEFSKMFKFVIIRNPYDRMISAWKYLFSGKQFHPKYIDMKNNLEAFLTDLPDFWERKYDRHIATHTAPIWNDITDHHGNLLVDYIVKLEDIDQELQVLNNALNTRIDHFEHINKNRMDKEYRKYYSETSLKLMEQLYHDDIEKLGYCY